MATVKDALAFLLKHYPIASECSNARITKMLYLADWHQAIHFHRQITPIRWRFDNYGPFVWDIYQEAARDTNLFGTSLVPNFYGNPKMLISLKDGSYAPELRQEEEQSLAHVIGVTKGLTWSPFIELVYSTYPILSSERYTQLDLIQKADEYRGLAA